MENYYYYSESGCIKIGNENFNSLLLNGKGEGSFWIKIGGRNEKRNLKGYEFVTEIEGNKICVYEAEKSKKTIITLNEGKYSLYRKDGNFLIKREGFC